MTLAAPPSVDRMKPAGGTPPSPWMRRWLPLFSSGAAVLDVACGWGRHTRWALEHGCRVTGVDRDVDRLGDLAARPDLEILEADLEDGSPWPLPGRAFDVVLVANYLHRPLFPMLERSVADGGLLLYETFMLGNEVHGRPRNPDHLLRPGELLGAFPGLSVIAFEQGEIDTCGTGVVQRLAAVKGSGPVRLPD